MLWQNRKNGQRSVWMEGAIWDGNGKAWSWTWYSRRGHETRTSTGRMNEGMEAIRIALKLPESIQYVIVTLKAARCQGRGAGLAEGLVWRLGLAWVPSVQIPSVVLMRCESRGNASMCRDLGLRRNLSQDTDLVVNTGMQVLSTWAVAGWETVAGSKLLAAI